MNEETYRNCSDNHRPGNNENSEKHDLKSITLGDSNNEWIRIDLGQSNDQFVYEYTVTT